MKNDDGDCISEAEKYINLLKPKDDLKLTAQLALAEAVHGGDSEADKSPGVK